MEIFLITAPGLEGLLGIEARERGFTVIETIPGGVTITGDW
jgi:putative N6-adenine-specific DNA methylase